MSVSGYDAVERGGWAIFVHREALSDVELRNRALEAALAAAGGDAIRHVRRSRHAQTLFARLGDAGPDVFIKMLAPARGVDGLKSALRGSRAVHVARISGELARSGIGVPQVLLYGREQKHGREMVMTERAPGYMAPRWFRDGRGKLEFRRALLKKLGAEVARLHRAGFIHGDLTPFNVVVAADREPPRISFIDHERTRRAAMNRGARPRLRNLVQLGRFELQGVGRTDRMRVWSAYARAMGLRKARAERNRVAGMLRARIARDGGMAHLPANLHPDTRAQTAEGR